MRIVGNILRGVWQLECEAPDDPCLECTCPVSNHGLHQVMTQTSNGRPAGSGYFLAPCKTHPECPNYKSRLEELSASN